MNIKSINNTNQKFGAGFSTEVKKIFQEKVAEELFLKPAVESKIDELVKRLRYSYFPNDIYIIAKSNNTKSSRYGRLALKDTQSRILSDLLNTDIWTIEQNVKAMAIKKHQYFNINEEALTKAENIINKYA